MWDRSYEAPVKKFVCGTIIPDCERVFTGPGDQSVLDQVLEHAAVNHGLATPPMPFIELVLTHTRPVLSNVGAGGAGGAGGTGTAGALAARRAPNLQVVRRPDPAADGIGCSNVHPLRRPTRRYRPGKQHETYRHECLLYTGTDGFVDAVVPFVLEGLALQEPVMIAVTGARLAALQSALAADAERVIFADMATLGHNPARIIPAWREFIGRHGGDGCRPVRGIGEPIWATRRPAEIVEAQLHEAMLNLAVSPDTPLWLLCPYDTADLDEQVIEEALRSHPVVVESNSYRGSTRYGGADHLDRFFRGPLPVPRAPMTQIGFDSAGHDQVDQILEFAAAAGLRIDRAAGLATAVDHLAVAAEQDNLEVELRIWVDDAAVVCEVADPDTLQDPMIGRGSGPALCSTPPSSSRDRAIRLANELCDLVQVRSGSAGTVVRVACWR